MKEIKFLGESKRFIYDSVLNGVYSSYKLNFNLKNEKRFFGKILVVEEPTVCYLKIEKSVIVFFKWSNTQMQSYLINKDSDIGLFCNRFKKDSVKLFFNEKFNHAKKLLNE